MTDTNKNIETQASPTMPPHLNTPDANRILNNVFESCHMEPSAIPIDVLQEWGNYNKFGFRREKRITYVLLIIVVLMPFLFFRPTIIADRIDVDNQKVASYEVNFKGLMPVNNVTATLDGAPVAVTQLGAKKYKVEAMDNGTLNITCTALNGQIVSRNYEVNYLDTDRPVYVGSEVNGSEISITVADTYSGIDYDNISGLQPISIDEENGVITFNMPGAAVNVTIPDKAGNELKLQISPDFASAQ